MINVEERADKKSLYYMIHALFNQALPYTVFQPQALEVCARKVAASSGDMTQALGICGGAIERLETELGESNCTSNLTSMVKNKPSIGKLDKYKQSKNIQQQEYTYKQQTPTPDNTSKNLEQKKKLTTAPIQDY